MRVVWIPLLLMALALAGGARATEPGYKPPKWATLPSGEVVDRFFPNAAYRAGIGGRVVLKCTVTIAGKPIDCEVISEDPTGYGFGPAAIRVLETEGLFEPAMRNGAPEEARIRIPFSFQAPEEPEDGVVLERSPLSLEETLACLAVTLDDGSVNADESDQKYSFLWYAFASLEFAIHGVGPDESADRIDKALARAARLRDDPAQAAVRSDCMIAIDEVLSGMQ